jgi:hypothetical protein
MAGTFGRAEGPLLPRDGMVRAEGVVDLSGAYWSRKEE